MTDTLSSQERSDRMRLIRSKDTKIEWLVRRLLFADGYRYRVQTKSFPGTPDVVFPKRKVAIFMHGCFWHQHPGCRIAHVPKSRSEYWKAKFDRNVQRDAEVYAALDAIGWKVIVVWECETRNAEMLQARLREKLGPPSAPANRKFATRLA